MKILILGGTRFLGPATVDYALERGHEVTLFNRGKTNPNMYPDLEKLRGDRVDDLSALEGDRTWDAVIDPSASVPNWVERSANLLAERAGMYVYISSISAYADFAEAGIDEEYATGVFSETVVEPQAPN